MDVRTGIVRASAFLASAVLLTAIVRDIRNGRSLSRTLTEADSQTVDSDFWVVIPALSEQDLVTEAVSHLQQLGAGTGRITIATNSSSVTPALRRAAELGLCELLVTEAVAPSKQELVGMAVLRAGHDAAVTIYDADSRPTALGCVKGGPHVCQQLSVYRAQGRGRSLASEFWRGIALNQTAWSLGTEARMLRHGRLYYLVGHGLTLPLEVIHALGLRDGYPGEDLFLGYQLSMSGVRAHISAGWDTAGIPETTREFVSQSARWFLGETTSLADTLVSHRHATLVLRCLAVAWWPLGPLVITASLVRQLVPKGQRHWRSYALPVIALSTRYWLASQTHRASSQILAADHPRRGSLSLAAFGGFLAKPCLSAVGAWWALARCGPRMSRGKAYPKARETAA